jgi:hypothetical protein
MKKLLVLIFKSYSNYKLLYSNYHFQHLDPGSQKKKLPKIIHQEDNGAITSIGDTDMMEGEMKNLLLHRKAVTAHFFENDNIWHCFFITYNSIKGAENWNGGQAHFHYISSSFGISKEQFLISLESGKYLSTSIHITLKDYGKQTISHNESKE